MQNEVVVKKKFIFDEHGQPIYRSRYHQSRLTLRTIDEIIGICKGIQSDGIINTKESHFLSNWLENNKKVANVYPINILAERVEKIFKDNIPDEDEKKDLFDTLYQITGYKPDQEIINTGTGEVLDNLTHTSSLLPLDNPPPSIVFKNKNFCLTGQFFFGEREKVINEIRVRKGLIHDKPKQKTSYLLIGLLGSTDWLHSTHGTKIEYAVKLRDRKYPIAIVSEEHWIKFL